MARFFSSTLMGLTATAGAIGAPGPAPPINTLFVDVAWLAIQAAKTTGLQS